MRWPGTQNGDDGADWESAVSNSSKKKRSSAHSLLLPALAVFRPPPPRTDTGTCHTRRRRRPPATHTPWRRTRRRRRRRQPLPKPPPAAASHAFAEGSPLPCHALSAARRVGGAPLATNSDSSHRCVAEKAATAHSTAATATRCAIRVGPLSRRRRPLSGQRDTRVIFLVLDGWRGANRRPLLSLTAAVRRPFW